MSLTPAQCRAARALISWTQDKLSGTSTVATKTIADFELGKRVPYPRTLDDLRSALEAAGVEFVAENGGHAGVRLRRLKPGERVRRIDTGEEGFVSDRVPQMGGMVEVNLKGGPLGIQRHMLAVVPPE